MLRKNLAWVLVSLLLTSIPCAATENTGNVNADIRKTISSDTPVDSGLEAILEAAKKRLPGTLERYAAWQKNNPAGAIPRHILENLQNRSAREKIILGHLAALGRIVADARSYADEALANTAYEKEHFHDLVLQAMATDADSHSLTVEAVELIGKAWSNADVMVKTRDELFDQYQDEIRRGKIATGTRLAWSLIRIGASHPETRIKRGSFRFDTETAQIELTHLGADVAIILDSNDYRQRFHAKVNGYNFRTGWVVLFQKPLGWMATVAREMAEAGISPDYHPLWDIMEAPEGLIALTTPDEKGGYDIPVRAFYKGELRQVGAIPLPEGAGRMTGEFLAAAETFHKGIIGDESIPRQLRLALNPILMGTYKPVDPRDYFDNDFCRRLIEADYLEAHITDLSEARRAELSKYREALAKVEVGMDRFAVDLGDAGRLVAVTLPEIDARNGGSEDYRDPETGETVSRYQWRWEKADSTLFHSPLSGRYLYAMSVLDGYAGKHAARPKGVPDRTEVWHAVLGKVAEYARGEQAAEGDAEKWQQCVMLDARGRKDTTAGPLGWNFPPYVPVRDDQGDPALIATLRGVVESPDFSGLAGAENRRRDQEQWLDKAAEVLATPGEMALIFQVFFRYCSDSPLPEMPNLVGSHYGLSDTHQTVYESLERRWVGRLIGDCDDLAEFFQNLATRQGKLAYVMQLPAHAAAGWLDEAPEGGYEFIVLQTGPVLRFTDPTRVGAVEKAYRHFEDERGGTQFTSAAVPLLLRFADEDTRTPFVLSARIYWDKEYASEMIKVQEYWHLHVYSAAVKAMEEMLKTDREAGNLKELASLYERVGEFEKSDAMRREELSVAGDDEQAALSTLLDLAQLHIQDKDKPKAIQALDEMEEKFKVLRNDKPLTYRNTTSFRYGWATLLARLGEPEKAWSLLQYDVEDADGKFSEHLLRVLVAVYDRMAIQRDTHDEVADSQTSTRVRYAVREALAKAFGKGYFKEDDSYNKIHTRYFWLGRYGVAVAGRRAGLESLWLDGPYPDGTRKHFLRDEDLAETDWEWLRVMPRLYLAYGMEMLDRDDNPEIYDPVGARRCLELVKRAQEKGTALGSNVMGRDAEVKSELALSFINRDLDGFRKVMTMVRGSDYSSLYDDAASTFGMYCGLLPISEFGDWLEAFREFFPGRQHYFKAAYRAMDKGHFDHSAMLAEATARFFPKDVLLVNEAEALRQSVEKLRKGRLEKDWDNRDWAGRERKSKTEPAAWGRTVMDTVEEMFPR